MIKKIARKFGYSLKRLHKSEDFDDSFALFLKFNPITTIIDCGANIGEYYRSVRKSGYTGRVLLIEPNPNCYGVLEEICAKDPKATLLKCACGTEAGEAVLNIVGADGESGSLSSLRDQTNFTQDRFNHAEVTSTVTVPVKRLDEILIEMGVGKNEILFLKTDTQGFDLDVLKSIGKFSKRLVGFQTELSVLPLYKEAPSHWEILEFARKNNFEPLGFGITSRNVDGRLIEYDAFFIRNNHYPNVTQ